MDDQIFLRADALRRTYATKTESLTVFDNLSFFVRRGESVAVTGASGIGKSSLLHILGGLDRPTAGNVYVGAAALWSLSATDRAQFRNRSVGFVFQFHHLLPEFSALENVLMPMLINGVGRAEGTKRAEELLERVGLADRKGNRPSELSGGESQRVALARALANNPPLLLADEPTGNLDERTGESIHRLLAALHRERRLSSIIVTHNPTLAALCDRILHLEHGLLYDLRELERQGLLPNKNNSTMTFRKP
jgi:lipoprotein-releasing system ATP-binding protein